MRRKKQILLSEAELRRRQAVRVAAPEKPAWLQRLAGVVRLGGGGDAAAVAASIATLQEEVGGVPAHPMLPRHYSEMPRDRQERRQQPAGECLPAARLTRKSVAVGHAFRQVTSSFPCCCPGAPSGLTCMSVRSSRWLACLGVIQLRIGARLSWDDLTEC